MVFYGQRIEQEKLCSQFPLHYITKTLSEIKELVSNVYRMYAVALTYPLTLLTSPSCRSMTDTRKANLVILSYEYQITKASNKVALMKWFSQKSRKIALF